MANKRLPNRDELLAWWILNKTEQYVDYAVLEIFDWLKEFRNSDPLKIYRHLWEEYEDFREEFFRPPETPPPAL